MKLVRNVGRLGKNSGKLSRLKKERITVAVTIFFTTSSGLKSTVRSPYNENLDS
jgi:hypothetical protein